MKKVFTFLVVAVLIILLGGCETVPVVVDPSGVVDTQSDLAATGATVDAGAGQILDHSQELADALAKLAAKDERLKVEAEKAARVAKDAAALKSLTEKLNKDILAARDEVTKSLAREAETSKKLVDAKQKVADLEKKVWPLTIALVAVGAFVLLYIFLKIKGALFGLH
jgi:hypothetical protein